MISVRKAGSLLNLYLTHETPGTSAERGDGRAIELLHLAAQNHGVFMAPRGLMALSTVMTEDTIGDVLERLGNALADLANELG